MADDGAGAAREFPRQWGLTRGFSLGIPRRFEISADGRRVLFLRSRGGRDPVTCLWALDLDTAAERLVADPDTLEGVGVAAGGLDNAERARRERVRETGEGILGYACDRTGDLAAFTVAGRLYLADVPAGRVRVLATPEPVADARPDPTGRSLGYVRQGALRVVDIATGADSAVLAPDGPATWGVAEFIAAEEMGRQEGYWWSPDGTRLLVAGVDESPVRTWRLVDPGDPAGEVREIRYPAAGTANAEVRLVIADLDGGVLPVRWDSAAFPYLAAARWQRDEPLIAVQDRAQTECSVLAVDPGSGECRVVHSQRDARWVDLVAGTPAQTGSGDLVCTADAGGTRSLLVGGRAVTPPGLQVVAVFDVDGEDVLFAGSAEPTEIGVWRHSPAGLTRLSPAGAVGQGRLRAGTVVLGTESLQAVGQAVAVHRDGAPAVPVVSHAEPLTAVSPRVELLRVGERELATAVLLPSWYEPRHGSLPVLMDPYGGPHVRRVLAARGLYAVPQWFAEQGYAVIVADGRGTPGRGPEWERAVHLDLAGPVLADQVAALQGVRQRYPQLDLSRVGIRGWSFGGYVAALAVLRRPDVFHAAVAGAPVTDWALYDTHYTERYLGHPDRQPEAYQRSSLIGDAPALSGSLLLIHGMADDNVFPVHTFRLSAALFAAGRPHSVLPLPGLAHSASRGEAAAQVLQLQAGFLAGALNPRLPG